MSIRHVAALRISRKLSQVLSFASLLLAYCASAEVRYTPAELGSIPVATTSTASTLSFTFSNQLTAPVFSLLFGGEFSLGSANCNGGHTSCTVPVTLMPKNPGVRTDVVIVRDSARNLLGRMVLSGLGTGPQASVGPGIVTQPFAHGNVSTAARAFAIDSANNVYTIEANSNQICRLSGEDQSATVIAGSTIPGYSGDGGPALNALLNGPTSLAIDREGSLFIADSNNNVIRKVDLVTGLMSTAVGTGTAGRSDSGPAATALLTAPFIIATDPTGNLYFLEQGEFGPLADFKVHKVDVSTQTLSIFAGTGLQGYAGDGGAATSADIDPEGLISDRSGNMYIVQPHPGPGFQSYIIRMISAGTISRFAGSDSGQTADGAPALATNFPSMGNLYFDPGGNLYFPENGSAIRRLSASAPHQVSTVFSLSSFGSYLGLLNLAIDAAGNFYTSDGLSQTAKISTQAAPLSFVSTNAGAISVPVQLVYYNTGNSTLNVSHIEITGANPGDFGQTNTCGSALLAGGACAITTSFTPQVMGSRAANMVITDNAPGSPRVISLAGMALSPQQAVTSTSNLAFAVQNGGTTSAPQIIRLSNPGIATLHISSVTVSDPSFGISNGCGNSLAVGAQCSISVTFSPRTNGYTSATLTITNDASNSPQTVELNGTATAVTAGGSVAPLSLDFGPVSIHKFGSQQLSLASQPKVFTITSTGNGNLVDTYLTLGGSNPADFAITNNCNLYLAPGSSCTVAITFTPTGVGPRTASLTVNAYDTTAAGFPQTVTLTGAGVLLNNAVRGGSGYLRVSADFDGDGKADLAFWRPTDGTWHIVPSGNPLQPITRQWGLPGDVPVPGDYDGDGKADIAVWRPIEGNWYIIPSSNPSAHITQQWGSPGDIPLVGDFDGDGKADLAIWRQSTGVWWVRPSSNPNVPIIQGWGVPDDIPLAGDFDGDGKADFAVWRPSEGNWYIIPTSNPSSTIVQGWGQPGDTPVAVDFDGDHKTDLAIWRPQTGTWWVIPSSQPSVPVTQQWGSAGDIPVPGDFDGDGKADFAVWRPASAVWYIIPSANPSSLIEQVWGARQDVILAGNFNLNFGQSSATSWHPDTGVWTVPVSSSSGTATTVLQPWGLPDDIPLLGDFDGDGIVDLTAWRPSTGTWYVIPSASPSSPIVRQWGFLGDIPVIGDFDGDGKADFAVWRPSTGTWYVVPSSNPSSPITTSWGLPGDIPVVGDFDSDGRADFTIWRPSNGTWYILPSSNPLVPIVQQWGLSGDIPTTARLYSSSFSPSSLMVWRPSEGLWYLFGTPQYGCQFGDPRAAIGSAGDLPFVIHKFAYNGYDGVGLWRPTESVMVSGTDCAGSLQQIGTPLDVPF